MIRHAQGPGHRAARGFTLLEVLAAFVVFALSFATILEILSGSIRSTVRAREYSEAALLAQSLMDMVGNEIPLYEGTHNGESDTGYVWAMDITLYQGYGEQDRTLELAELNGTMLYWVDLNLAWGEGRRARDAQFTTVRGTLEGRTP